MSRVLCTTLLFLFVSLSGYAQKNKDVQPVVYCVKDLGNGLHQASFGYDNPTNKEVTVGENDSRIKFNKGKKVIKGLAKFKKGSHDKVFTKEFGPGDYVEWTIINRKGKAHTVIANANSAKKCAPDDGFIFPVIGNGKSLTLSGNELESFCLDISGESPPELIFQTKLDNGELKILVEIIPKPGSMLMVMGILQNTFMISNNDFLLDPNLYDYATLSAIDVFMTQETACQLDEYFEHINFARPVYPASINSGGVLSQGDAAQTSNLVRESYRIRNSEGAFVPVDAFGITVGVMSDSYDTFAPGSAANDVANGELPDDVVVLKDNLYKASDEGRAMMQIIHDVAPGAALQFHTATASPRQFEVAFNALALECDIIVDDITFITEPFFDGGRIPDAINISGKTHFTSAGNIANKAFQATFDSSGTIPVTNFIDPSGPTVAHDFDSGSGTDYFQKISVLPGTYLIALQWKEAIASQDNSTGALQDLDIYIVDDNGRLLVGSNRVNVEGDPTEVIVFRATGTGEANIFIASANGSTNVPFRYIAFRTAADDGTPDGLKILEYFGNGASTISGHAMNSASRTVGAVDYRNAASPVAENFSSYGGTLPDGTQLEVDLYAPDGGNTSLTSIGQPAICTTCDGDSFLNFYGTSAAAPHAAAVDALLMSSTPVWFPPSEADLLAGLKTSFSKEQALQTFKSTATSFTAADGSTGQFINALAAFKSIASQTARITELVVQDGKTPSAEPFTVTIIGDFFPDNVEGVTVLFDGQPLEDVAYATGTTGETVITATVPTFSGNPKLTIRTAGITPGNGDETESDPAYVLDEGKIALNIIANSAQFEYGQDIGPSYYSLDPTQPDYVQPFIVEGLPEGVTFESLVAADNLPQVILNNSAVDQKLAEGGYPVVFDYVITPSFGDQVLTEEQLAKYQINFISGYNDPDLGKRGYLTITKKDLTITSTAVTGTYGEAIIVPLSYDYDATGITDDTNFRASIANAHSNDFFEENRLGVINKYRALISDYPMLISDFSGASWIATEQTLTNKYRALISTMGIVDLEEEQFVNYINSSEEYNDGNGGITSKYRALISKFRALISSEDLFSGNVLLNDPITNKYRALISKYRALISEDGAQPYGGYESVFAIVSDEEPLTGEIDEDGLEIVEIPELYALNMITGLDVTVDTEGHIVYPGAFLNALSNNFNITYLPGEYFVDPATLTGSTLDLTIPYGQTLKREDLTTTFEGFVFDGPNQETAETVFPDGIPYYFIKVGGDDTELELNELKELGDYECRFKNPQNYVMSHIIDETHGIVTIAPTVLTVETVTFETPYGQNFAASDLTTVFGDFAYESESSGTVFPDGVPYYFVDDDLNEYELNDRMDVGTYEIKIRGTAEYLIEYGSNHSSLTITPAPLFVKTEELEIQYGDDLQSAISTVISGFAYDDTLGTIFPEGIMYVFIDDLDAEFDLESIRELGIYSFNVLAPTTSSNYEILYADDHGLLTISPRLVKVRTENINEKYGYYTNFTDLTTQFMEFAPNETVADVFGPSGIPYYFVGADGSVYNLGDELELGVYEIKLEETNDHYIFEYDTSANVLSISQNTLMVTIDDLTITEGDIPVFNSTIEGFVYGESVATVFPEGIQYYIVDENGNEKDFNDIGQHIVKIIAPDNYDIEYTRQAKLNIEAKLAQIKIYLDCVENHYHHHHHDHYDKLKYTATFRYVNPNDRAVLVNIGTNNSIYGYGKFENDVPTVFLPGENTFEIRFDGRAIKWKLKSYEGEVLETDKAYASRYSKRCDRSSCQDDDHDSFKNAFVIYPNPVKDWLQVEQNVSEICTIEIYNMYGMLYKQMQTEPKDNQRISIDLSSYSSGPYIVRITLNGESRVYNIIKE